MSAENESKEKKAEKLLGAIANASAKAQTARDALLNLAKGFAEQIQSTFQDFEVRLAKGDKSAPVRQLVGTSSFPGAIEWGPGYMKMRLIARKLIPWDDLVVMTVRVEGEDLVIAFREETQRVKYKELHEADTRSFTHINRLVEIALDDAAKFLKSAEIGQIATLFQAG